MTLKSGHCIDLLHEFCTYLPCDCQCHNDAAHWVCDCVPDVGPPHCHGCDPDNTRPVPATQCPVLTPTTPAGIDETARDHDAEALADLGDVGDLRWDV